MKKQTTSKQLNTAIVNNLLQIDNAKVHYKTSGKKETIDATTFRENFSILCESGVLADCIGWHYERDSKTNDYIVECGRMNPDTEVIITGYLSVCDGVNGEDVERILNVTEEW